MFKYVRNNDFSNGSLIDVIEEHGGEAWLTPMHEYILYTAYYQGYMAKRQSAGLFEKGESVVKNLYLYQTEKRYNKAVRSVLGDRHEPDIKDIIEVGKEYFPVDFSSEAILTVGSVQMAEYVLHQLLEASRGMETYREQQRQCVWKIHRPIRRSEWPVGVMGLGHIGKRVARTLADLDYRVNGWARSNHALDKVSTFAGAGELPDFLGSTRVLVNTLPLTDETRDILNHQLFSQLMPGAVVINVGRGEHLVEEDLLRAIDDGHVARASLDVFRQEPLAADHPFWQRPEITVTPHISARTLRDATLEQITGKIRAHYQNQPITGIVDTRRGY
ncbi:MAG: NAD(P)-dependent oxidoreductase [Marinobacter sp.]